MNNYFLNETLNYIYLHEQVKNIKVDKMMIQGLSNAAKRKNPVKMIRMLKNVPDMTPIEVKNYGTKALGAAFKQNYDKALRKMKKETPAASLTASLYASIKSFDTFAKEKKNNDKAVVTVNVDFESIADSLLDDAWKIVGRGLRTALVSVILYYVAVFLSAPGIIFWFIAVLGVSGKANIIFGLILVVIKAFVKGTIF